MSDNLRDAALEYHRLPTRGKIAAMPTSAMATQRNLALAYSPPVAQARPVHIMTPSSTVQRIVNMPAVAVVDAASGSARR